MVGFSVVVERVVVTRWAFCRVYVTNDLSSAFRTISRKWSWPPHRSTVIFRPSVLKSSCSCFRILSRSSFGPLAMGII